MCFDPRAFHADIETVAHLALVLSAQLAAQERGDVVGFDGVDGRPRQVAIDGRQIRLPPENNVGSVLALIHAPVVSHTKIPMKRTKPACHSIQALVKPLDPQSVGGLLRPPPIRDIHEGIVNQLEVDLALAQHAG